MTSFPTYSFTATGAPTNRSLPTRLSEIVNVKDWGAKGDGTTNDSTAINNAINYALTRSAGGIIFFPAGTYYLGNPATPIDIAPFAQKVGGPPVVPGVYTLQLIGASRSSTIITGTADANGNPPVGYYDDLSGSTGWTLPVGALIVATFGNNATPNTKVHFPNFGIVLRDMTIQNNSTQKWSCAAAFQPAQSGSVVENCKFVGVNGFAMAGFGGTVINCSAVSNSAIPTADSYPHPDGLDDYSAFVLPANGQSYSVYQGSVGITQSQGPILGCDATGFDIGFGIGGVTKFFAANRASRCGIGVHSVHTWTWEGRVPPTRGLMSANSIDRSIYGTLNGSIDAKGNIFSGTQGPAGPAAIQSMSYKAGSHVVTATTTVNHNIPSTPRGLILAVADDWLPASSVATGLVTITGTPAANTFTYAGPSVSPTLGSAGTWNYPTQYCYNGVDHNMAVGANIFSAVCSGASFLFGGSPFSQSEQSNCVAMAMEGAYGWAAALPPSVYWNSWKFEMCGTTGTNNNPLVPIVLFNYLPPYGVGPPQKQFRMEGQQYWILDGQKSGGGVAALGDIVAGGGGQKIGVRFDGTNWIRFA